MEKSEFFASLCRQTKVCSLAKALHLAKVSGYNSKVVAAIIQREDCVPLVMWALLEKAVYITQILKTIVKSSSFEEVSFKQLLWLFTKVKREGGTVYEALKIVSERKILDKFSFEDLLFFSEKIGYTDPVITNIGQKKSWQELDLESACSILRNNDSAAIAAIVIGKKNCPLERALNILHYHKNPTEIFGAIIARNDFKLSLIFELLEEPIWGKSEDVIMQNIHEIVARPDCSITRAYKLLKRAKKYNQEAFLGATMALIQKDKLPFFKAIDLMMNIDCHKEAVVSFELRRDFNLEHRVALVETMEGCVSRIYEKHNEPSYDNFDLEKIIEKGDWINPTLYEALSLNKKLPSLFTPLQIISQRDDWKALSFNEAVKLASETGSEIDVKGLIIAQKDCSLDQALSLAKFDKAKETVYDSRLLSVIIGKGIASFEDCLKFLKQSNDQLFTVASIVEKMEVSLEEMIKLKKNGFDNLANLDSAICKSRDWETISFDKAFDFLKITYKEPLGVIVKREDWKNLPFESAYNFLNGVNWKSDSFVVVPSLISKQDCPLKTSLELFSLLDSKLDHRKTLISITSRLDNSLEEALELSKETYYGSFGGIVLRSDWKELPLEKVYEYIEKYPSNDLIMSLMEREDWKNLPFETVVAKTPKLEGYYFSLYLGLIISNEKQPLIKALSLIKENKYDSILASNLVSRSDCSLELASNVFRETDHSASMVKAISNRSDFNNLSIEEALEFAKKTSSGFYSLIVEREDWKTIPLEKSLSLAEKHDYNNSIMISFFSHKDWSQAS